MMIGEVFFILICTTSIQHFEASYFNPFYGFVEGMVFNDLINKIEFKTVRAVK